MISFIIIGKNIELTAQKCIQSIYSIMGKILIVDFEVIYVDSKSSDKTIEFISKFPEVRKYQITGTCNAAIARNIGAREAKCENLVFLDGDMELVPDLLSVVFDEKNDLKYNFISGDLVNYFYNLNGKKLGGPFPYFEEKLQNDRIEYVTGGFFIIKKTLWEQIGGMRTYFRRSQDLDLGLRLAKFGYPLLRKKELMAIHHTVSYFDNDRLIKMIKQGDYLYPALLIRKHLFNPYAWKMFVKMHNSAMLLIVILILSMLFSYKVLLIYFVVILGRSILKKSKQNKIFIFHFFVYLITDFFTLIGFLFFFPTSKKLSYKTIL